MAMKVSSRTVCAMPSDIFLFLVTGISCREKNNMATSRDAAWKTFQVGQSGVFLLNTGVGQKGYFHWNRGWDRGGISIEYRGGTERVFPLNTGMGQRGYFHWIRGWTERVFPLNMGVGQRGYFHWIWTCFSTLLGFNKSTALVSGALTYKTSKVHPWVHQLKMRPK